MNNRKIRCGLLNLIFLFLVTGCSEKSRNNASVSIQWQGNKAVGIIVPVKLLSTVPGDSIDRYLHIYLSGSHQQSILGKYSVTQDSVIFHPLIAFTRGLQYEVYSTDKLLAAIVIPPADPNNAPVVGGIYPGNDTLPENLLKIHVTFTKPMQEGQALEHIVIIKDDHDTLRNVFLDLQPELWNSDRTMLTLWLDPGRIKRDLQPNIKMGLPLQAGSHYQLSILQNWPGAEGIVLRTAVYKNFVTTMRDEQSPEMASWTINEPGSVREKLEVDFHESLDYVLIQKAIFIIDARGHEVKGLISIKKEETGFSFTPSIPWEKGTYTIECESRLEDMAGNNLNRLFDKDLTQKETREEKEIFKRSFQVRE